MRFPGEEVQGNAFLSRARASLRQVGVMVDGLLEFARAGAQPPAGARSDPARVLHDLAMNIDPAAAAARVELRIAQAPRLEVAAGPGVLTSLLRNLIENAIRYLGDSGVRRIEVRIVDQGERARFEVEDTGPGIPPEKLRRLFEPHLRGLDSGGPGIGLGLATVKRLAEAHGGQVGASSRPGKGSCFWFELPKAPPACSSGPLRAPEEPAESAQVDRVL